MEVWELFSGGAASDDGRGLVGWLHGNVKRAMLRMIAPSIAKAHYR